MKSSDHSGDDQQRENVTWTSTEVNLGELEGSERVKRTQVSQPGGLASLLCRELCRRHNKLPGRILVTVELSSSVQRVGIAA
jgi:hypothetical protein